jgi:hypothetical protein
MKNIILIIIIFIATYNLQAQTPNFEWIKSNESFQGLGNVGLTSMTIDASGNIYSIGGFLGTVDFNPSYALFYNLTSTPYFYSYYIQKLTPNGDLIWVKTIDFPIGSLKYIKIDDNDNLILNGNFEDSVDIDPGTTTHMLYSNGEYDIFILKLSANGNFIWAKSFGGSENDIVRDITTDSYGNVYSHGSYKDTVDFDPGPGICIHGANYAPPPSPHPLDNAFIQKLDNDGNFVWAKTFECGEGSFSDGFKVDIDSDDNVYCSGYFFGSNIDFDPGIGVINPPSNNSGMYLVKLDSMGSHTWASFSTKIGIGGYASPDAMVIDRFNNVFITGYSNLNIDFDPGPDTLLLTETTFIQKYDQNGNFLWAKSYGYGDNPMALATDTFVIVYSTGYFSDSTDLDPGPDTLKFYTYGQYSTSYGTYLQKLNPTGDLLWAGILQANLGGSGGNDIFIDNISNIFVAGSYGGTVDFDPGPGIHNQTQANESSYILKLSQCQVLTIDYQISCDSLTWMDSITYYHSTNSAYFTLPSSSGCDSVICLNLNIPQIDTSVGVSPSGVFSSNQNFASYQWLDCNNALLPLSGDTLRSFTPTQNGDYAVAINVSGCVDTSVCVNINNVSIEEIAGNMIKLYPNPNNGKFMLNLGSIKATEIMVINSLGQIILVKHNFKSKYFDLALNPGVYFIQIQSDNYNKTIKFLVR